MSLRVLLLDDDVALTSELERVLVERSCEVVTAADADDGIGAAATQKFDVLLVAPEHCDRIKDDPATAGLPLMVLAKPVDIEDLLAALPARRASVAPRGASMPPSGDLRETVKNQGRTITSLRSDLAARGRTIDTLTAKCKELTQRLNDVLGTLESAEKERAVAVAGLEAIKQERASEVMAAEAARAAEAADHERAHAEEMQFLERAHEEATEAATRRLRDSERALATERETNAAASESHALEIASFREFLSAVERERDVAIAERDEARTRAETIAMDVAQAQMDLAEEARARTAELQAQSRRIAELEEAIASHSGSSTRIKELEAEVATMHAKIIDMTRAIDAAEREAAQQQLARDAYFHDLNARMAEETAAAVAAAKEEAAAEREELVRQHEHAIKIARDKAIAQTLAVARERKKQT